MILDTNCVTPIIIVAIFGWMVDPANSKIVVAKNVTTKTPPICCNMHKVIVMNNAFLFSLIVNNSFQSVTTVCFSV